MPIFISAERQVSIPNLIFRLKYRILSDETETKTVF